jgi:predicted AAA+ superfamily ATPase
VRDAIVDPAIGRDILALGPIRKPALLRQVFAVAASSPAQIVALKKLQGQLQDRGALETIAHYLSLLAEAYLIAPLTKFGATEPRARAAPPKLITLSNALLAVTDPGGIPTQERDPERFGMWVENACLAFAWNQGQKVQYWREEPLEVDGVIEGSWGKWAIEVKTGRVEATDLKGLAELTRRFPSYRPLLIGDDNARTIAERAGIFFISWRQFLLNGTRTLLTILAEEKEPGKL